MHSSLSPRLGVLQREHGRQRCFSFRFRFGKGAPPQGAGVGAQAQRVKAGRRRKVLRVWFRFREGAPPQGAGVGAQAQGVKAVRRRQVLQVRRDGRARQPGLLRGRGAARLRRDRAHGARHLAAQQSSPPRTPTTDMPGSQEGCPGAVARRAWNDFMPGRTADSTQSARVWSVH